MSSSLTVQVQDVAMGRKRPPLLCYAYDSPSWSLFIRRHIRSVPCCDNSFDVSLTGDCAQNCYCQFFLISLVFLYFLQFNSTDIKGNKVSARPSAPVYIISLNTLYFPYLLEQRKKTNYEECTRKIGQPTVLIKEYERAVQWLMWRLTTRARRKAAE